MSRLKKIADNNDLLKEKNINLEAAEIALNEIEKSIEGLQESYLKLFHGLNSLYDEFPKLYNEMVRVIKFPTEADAQDVAEMKIDFDDIRSHYTDKEYLSEVLNLYND